MNQFIYQLKLNRLVTQYQLEQKYTDLVLKSICKSNSDRFHCGRHMKHYMESKRNLIKLQGNVWLLNRQFGIA